MKSKKITIGDIQDADIPKIMDYWFNPENKQYHNDRGVVFNDKTLEKLNAQPVNLTHQINTPPTQRKSTTCIVSINGIRSGHVLLNDIHTPEQCRIHFHLWRNITTIHSLGETLSILTELIPKTLDHLFKQFNVEYITGDISQTNKPAIFVLKRLGINPTETVQESYLGRKSEYLRYIFKR